MSAQRYYGIWGENSRAFLTSGGRVIIHHNRAEMQFLFPHNTIKEIWVSPDPDKTIGLRFVPGLEHIRWPLRKEDFR